MTRAKPANYDKVQAQVLAARNTKAPQTRREIARLEQALADERAKLDSLTRECGRHVWGEVIYTPTYHEGYTIPGDGPEFGGIDRQGPCYVGPKTDQQWTRVCINCGHVQTTTRLKKQHVTGAIPGTGGQIDVPDFGDDSRY